MLPSLPRTESWMARRQSLETPSRRRYAEVLPSMPLLIRPDLPGWLTCQYCCIPGCRFAWQHGEGLGPLGLKVFTRLFRVLDGNNSGALEYDVSAPPSHLTDDLSAASQNPVALALTCRSFSAESSS